MRERREAAGREKNEKHTEPVPGVQIVGSGAKKMLKYAKTATVLNYFECYFIYPKVCKVYCICLFWLRDF